jgi:hydroxypyruvate isomerase
VKEFNEGVDRAIDYATALGCKQLNCLAGIPPAGAEPAEVRATFVGNLQRAAAKLKAGGIRLLIEPINTRDIPNFFLSHTGQAIEIIRAVGSDNVFLQYDVYHMQIMEGDLTKTIERQLPAIAHMQIADPPLRNEPGTGEINFSNLFREIDRLGYTGWIGCEYKPAGRTEDGLGWFASYKA